MKPCEAEQNFNHHGKNIPLIHEGIDWPVRKPTQSFVKELQLKSAISREATSSYIVIWAYLTDDTSIHVVSINLST